jgi:pyruvate dehydrogenase E1 component beta subunit
MLTGAALGASLMGLRPVLIHRRVDWLPLTMDQIVSAWAKWNFMFGDQQRVGCVARGIVGRGWGNGPQHSQSLHGFCASVPGLQVVVPATPADAKGLTLSTIFSDTPSIFIDHRSLHGIVDDVPEGDYRIPIGTAAVERAGADVSVIAAGPMVQEALKAAAELAPLGVAVEVINLRSIRPLDFDTVETSVRKTGRLIAADADWPHYGVAATIVAEMARRVFGALKHAPETVTWPDHPVPASHGVEPRYYPGAPQIRAAVARQLRIPDAARHETAVVAAAATSPF